MSYCFDVTRKVWATLREQLPPDVRESEVTVRFEFLLEELHECDHRLRGQINHDAGVTKYAHKLDGIFTEAQKGKP